MVVDYHDGSPAERLEQFCMSDGPCTMLATAGSCESLLHRWLAYAQVCVVCVVDTCGRSVEQLLSHILLMRMGSRVECTTETHHLLYKSGDLLSSLKRDMSQILKVSKVARYAENHSECRVQLLSRLAGFSPQSCATTNRCDTCRRRPFAVRLVRLDVKAIARQVVDFIRLRSAQIQIAPRGIVYALLGSRRHDLSTILPAANLLPFHGAFKDVKPARRCAHSTGQLVNVLESCHATDLVHELVCQGCLSYAVPEHSHGNHEAQSLVLVPGNSECGDGLCLWLNVWKPLREHADTGACTSSIAPFLDVNCLGGNAQWPQPSSTRVGESCGTSVECAAEGAVAKAGDPTGSVERAAERAMATAKEVLENVSKFLGSKGLQLGESGSGSGAAEDAPLRSDRTACGCHGVSAHSTAEASMASLDEADMEAMEVASNDEMPVGAAQQQTPPRHHNRVRKGLERERGSGVPVMYG